MPDDTVRSLRAGRFPGLSPILHVSSLPEANRGVDDGDAVQESSWPSTALPLFSSCAARIPCWNDGRRRGGPMNRRQFVATSSFAIIAAGSRR